MNHPLRPSAAPIEGGNTGGPAEPDPRCSLGLADSCAAGLAQRGGATDMKTMRVQSLKLRLILQMLVILLPVTLLLGYQAWMDQRRAEIVDRAYQLASKAKQAHERYRSFVQGVSDAVDTGRVSRSAMAALEQA